jgi:hypothetical protein
MVEIRFQDPTVAAPQYLLEELVGAARDASTGVAIFAFASRDGARLLIGDAEFQALLHRGSFELVVGIDAITNVPAIGQLRAYAAASPSLNVRVFVHDTDALFHPKLAWFAWNGGGAAFVGSGNLTPGGLAENWEAYARVALDAAGCAALEKQWGDWCSAHAGELLDLDDPEVDTRAALNIQRRRPRGKPAPAGVPQTAAGDRVLLAEIPKASDRWKQANFDLESFRGFFGADPVASHRIVLWRLDNTGAVQGVESRPTVSVRSHNFRIELEAAAGLAYPAGDDRPIGAFLRTAPRRFRYVLLMPGDTGYDDAMRLLERAEGPRRPSRMRRHSFDRDDVEAEWPESPLFVPVTDPAEDDAADAI